MQDQTAVTTDSVKWSLGRGAARADAEAKMLLGLDAHTASRDSLRDYLCRYFSASPDCSTKQGKSISPLKAGGNGFKRLKVRWAYPGCGKSGGLRLAVAVKCDERIVVIAGVYSRNSDPSDATLESGFDQSEPSSSQ